MLHEDPKLWCEALLVALWAYRTSKCGLTKATYFSQVYEIETILHVKIIVPTARFALSSKLNNDHL